MKIPKVRYPKLVPGIEHHCAAFLTQSGQVILIASILDEQGICPIFNSRDAVRLIKDIMKGKKKSTTVLPFPGVITWETRRYDETLVGMAKSGQLVNAAVIENIPESEEDLERFAGQVLRG